MDRRRFLGLLGGATAVAVGGVVLDQAIPLGRVWSFPSEITVASPNQILSMEYANRQVLRILLTNLKLPAMPIYDGEQFSSLPVGSSIRVLEPPRFFPE